MGMYTGLRGVVRLKSEYTKRIKETTTTNGYFEWKEILSDTPELNPFLQDSRKSFIPCGAVCYMPSEWEREAGWFLNDETNTFLFCCSLKNYNGTIKKFISLVLPEIAESWYLQELYEEATQPIIHQQDHEVSEEKL